MTAFSVPAILEDLADLGREAKSLCPVGTKVTVLVEVPGCPPFAITNGTAASIEVAVDRLRPDDVWDLYDRD